MKTIYISGSITNEPKYKELFKKAHDELEARGYKVVNPSCLHESMTYKQYIDITLEMLKSCDVIYMLKNWEYSKGAVFEHTYARTINMKFVYE